MRITGEGNTSNPLKQVLNAIGEKVDCAVYDRVSTPDLACAVMSRVQGVTLLLHVQACAGMNVSKTS